ncbi:hypothetical protein N7G274_009462 [Stereocaulon virgatum]|uniref:Uncharacterized protein n=1 Tax=Stereocaulon virgatum TaxID=373712 RepID=A0ABR3ZVV2_9LECA
MSFRLLHLGPYNSLGISSRSCHGDLSDMKVDNPSTWAKRSMATALTGTRFSRDALSLGPAPASQAIVLAPTCMLELYLASYTCHDVGNIEPSLPVMFTGTALRFNLWLC